MPDVTRERVRALLLVGALVLAYGLGILAIELRVHSGHGFVAGVPLAIVGKPFFPLGLPVQLEFGATVLAETALLLMLLRLDKALSTLRFAVPIASAAMFAISLLTDFTNIDPYLYVYYGKEPSSAAAYRQDATMRPLPTGFAGLAVLHVPVGPSPYGPLWQGFDRAIVGPTRSLPEALRTVRLASAAALAATFLVLLALRLPAAATAAIVLNPALYYLYVVHAHNDVDAILFTTAGVALARMRYPLLAAACGAIAGASKVSLIVIAIAAIGALGGLRTRLACAAAIVAGAALLSWGLGGAPYVQALASVGSGMAGQNHTGALEHAIRLTVQALALALTLIAVVAAVGFQRRFSAATLIFPSVSGLVQPWYSAWGLPYALTDERLTRTFCTLLPLVAYLTDPALAEANGVHFATLVFAVIALALALQLARSCAPTRIKR